MVSILDLKKGSDEKHHVFLEYYKCYQGQHNMI